MGIWIGVNISIIERNLGFFSNENYRWSSNNEGMAPGPEERLWSIRFRALKCPKNQTMTCVVSRLLAVHHPSPCDSWLSAWSIRKFHQAYLKFAGPILNCHTCSYMNDQGKCLRGEGVCSTQNSQQCMLKKIFEGMWRLHSTVCARETHQLTWVLLGATGVVGAQGGVKLWFPRNWRVRRTLSFQELRAEFLLLMGR